MSELSETLRKTTEQMAATCSVPMELWCEHSAAVLKAAEEIERSPSVIVRDLEWVQMDDGETYHAQSILGRWARWDGHYLPPDGYGGIACDDPKAAAQADYEARILSALAAAPTNPPALSE